MPELKIREISNKEPNNALKGLTEQDQSKLKCNR